MRDSISGSPTRLLSPVSLMDMDREAITPSTSSWGKPVSAMPASASSTVLRKVSASSGLRFVP